jgi:uncharacterized protein
LLLKLDRRVNFFHFNNYKLITYEFKMGLSQSRDSYLQVELLGYIEKHQEAQLDAFLKAHPELVDSKLCNDSTNTMCRATFLGYKNIVLILLKHGANVNLCSQNGRSPLIWAAYRNHVNVIDLLLENGADTSIRDQAGLNAFEMATTLVNYEAALMLR